MQPGRRRRAGEDDDAAIKGGIGLEGIDGASHAGGLLADRYVDTDDVAVLLADDGVDCQSGLAGRMVADNQLALTATERKQRIDDHDAGLHRFGNEVALDNGRRRSLDWQLRLSFNRAFAVERTTERIHDPAEQGLAHRNTDHVARTAYGVARLDGTIGIEENTADAVGIQHLGVSELSLVETQQLVEPHIGQAGNHRDAVTDLLDPADLFRPGPSGTLPTRVVAVASHPSGSCAMG